MVSRIKGFIRDLYWSGYSMITKDRFNKGKLHCYRYRDELFFDNKSVFDDAFEQLEKEYEFWGNQSDYTLNTYFPERHDKRREMLFDSFLPLLGSNPVVMDVGCASGEWTSQVAPYCRFIDGFDYSQSLINSASEKYKDIHNVSFAQSDAINIVTDKVYDGIMMLGVLMYSNDSNDIFMIISNISRNLKKDGFLYASDTINLESKDVVYMFNKRTGYKASYFSKEVFFEQFKKAGLELVEESIFDEVKTRRMHFAGCGTIWRKPPLQQDNSENNT